MLLPRPLALKARDRKPAELGPVVRAESVRAGSGGEDRKLEALIKPAGLRDWDGDGLKEQANEAATMWEGPWPAVTSLEFDLPEAVPLAAIEVWNFNAPWRTTNGVRRADISVSADGTTWETALRGAAFAQADGRDDYDDPIVFKLKDTTARKVRFENMASWGGANIGLSKVVFHQAAGPQAGPRQPEDGATSVSLNKPALEWVPGQGAGDHRVYFGTLPDKLELLGTSAEARLAGPVLKPDTTYYWRVDEVQAGGTVITGRVARFESAGLLAWWKLDETEGTQAVDSTPNQNTGRILGKAHWAIGQGRIGGALEFDGKSNHIFAGNKPEFDGRDALTVSVWVKARKFDKPWQAIVAKGDTAWRLQRASDKSFVTFDVNLGTTVENGLANLASVRTKRELDDAKWHHLAATYDGRKISLYLDGELQQSNDAKGPLARNNDALMIGDNSARRGRNFDGWLDDVRIYGYALTAEEVQALNRGVETQRASR
ncbi:MAG TPA: LamG-like jellyroll fold domain-containing protein [Verrucomicrobiae bacterium]